MKKVWKYLTITLLLLLGLFCVGLLYIFFVPGSSLFTLCYISYNDTFVSDVYSSANVTQVSLNSNRYDVNIYSSNSSDIYAKLTTNSFGFTTTKYSKAYISTNLNGSTLKIDVKEPIGAVISTDSYIELYLPLPAGEEPGTPIDLTINNKRAVASIDSDNVIINKLNYKTTNGELSINNADIKGDLNLSLGNSHFTLGKDTKLHGNDVYLDISTGKFDSSAVVLGDIKITNNKRGVIVVGACYNLTEDIKSAGGRIEVDTVVETLSITTSDTNVYAKSVNSAVITLTKSGSVSIDHIFSYSVIDTHLGNITLDVCESNVLTSSDYGNITIKNATKKVIAKSLKSGNISISYFPLSGQYSTLNQTRCIEVEINKGSLSSSEIENANIKITGNASINLGMRNILGVSNIEVGSGFAKVVIDANATYDLTSTSDTGSTRVNLLQIEDFGGYTKNISTTNPLKVNGNTTTNAINLKSTSGSILVLDTKLA